MSMRPFQAAPSHLEPISLFVCGDVITGRGLDQILPHHGNPVLYEPQIRDAGDFVRLAERVSG
jgi:poly-gamma-glutamate synthesis protein (capsule biosynthesis protein)